MSLQKLDIYALRIIQHISFEPAVGINLITGKNASGKSSILEAIFILGRARSFRANHARQVINFNKDELIVSGQSKQKNGDLFHLGIRLNGKQYEIRINQENTSKAELAHAFPVLLIHPKSYRLIDGSPVLRREFLDWGVFNEDENFLQSWRQFKKALEQRNALLKIKQLDQIDVWNTEVVKYGTIVTRYRNDYLKKLKPVFLDICLYFLDSDKIELNYLTGWDKAKSFDQALVDDRNKDIKYGYTHSGPHRCDFQLLINARLAKDFVSRGQLKLLMLSLKLAQVQLMNDKGNNQVCLLIDDLTAELDDLNKNKLLTFLSKLQCQVFMTSTELGNFGDLDLIYDYKMFHVEQGNIILLNKT